MQLKTLETLILEANRAYLQGSPTLSDEEYDGLLEQLPEHHRLRVYLGEASQRPTYKHHPKMLSLSKAKTLDQAMVWASKWTPETALIVLPKLDGVACRLIFYSGIFVGAYTRGDGEFGEDISSKVVHVLARSHLAGHHVLVDGELVLSKDKFSPFKKQGAASARSVVVGLLSRDDSYALADAGVQFLGYAVHGGPTSWSTTSQALAGLEAQGVPTALVMHHGTAGSLTPGLLESARQSAKNSFVDTDGIVLRMDDRLAFGEQGATEHAPKGALALKHDNEVVTTTLSHVEWQIGRSGTVTPVVYVEPVTTEGATLRKATLHNAAQFLAFSPSIGSEVQIKRSGGVIPFVVSMGPPVGGPSQCLELPQVCPSCGGRVEYASETQIDLVCVTARQDRGSCPQAACSGLCHFAKVLGIDGIGPEIAETLVEAGATTGADVFSIAAKAMFGEFFTSGISRQLQQQVEAKTTLALAELLESLGMEMWGKVACQTVARNIPSSVPVEVLSQLDGFDFQSAFGPVVAQKMRASWAVHRATLQKLLRRVQLRPIDATAGLFGKVFVFTGELSISRTQAERAVVSLGATVATSVSKRTTSLVCADVGEQSTKTKKALALQAGGHSIEILNEAQFRQLVCQSAPPDSLD